jgi:uncharacterized protein YndB with AHSA1/START domain
MTIRKSVTVRCPPDKAFRVFTREIGHWWPLARGFSMDRERAHEIYLDDRVGGRFYERFIDGAECEIGRVIRSEPPHLIVFTFKPPAWEEATEVEVRFAAEAGGTRVELEHRGFDASPGMRKRGKNFSGGWETVLAQYVGSADDRVDEPVAEGG